MKTRPLYSEDSRSLEESRTSTTPRSPLTQDSTFVRRCTQVDLLILVSHYVNFLIVSIDL